MVKNLSLLWLLNMSRACWTVKEVRDWQHM